MKLSPYFRELSSQYAYEIEDLTWDSGGGNVLAARLRDKRKEFAELLAMRTDFPVMVVPVFRGAFKFADKAPFDRLVASQPGQFPSWPELAAALEIEPWAGALAIQALAQPEGEQFMLIAAGLEYIQSGHASAVTAVEAEPSMQEGRETDEEDEDHADPDLAEAGEDYLSEQGFDRRN